jgi:hypothetical protein
MAAGIPEGFQLVRHHAGSYGGAGVESPATATTL